MFQSLFNNMAVSFGYSGSLAKDILPPDINKFCFFCHSAARVQHKNEADTYEKVFHKVILEVAMLVNDDKTNFPDTILPALDRCVLLVLSILDEKTESKVVEAKTTELLKTLTAQKDILVVQMTPHVGRSLITDIHSLAGLYVSNEFVYMIQNDPAYTRQKASMIKVLKAFVDKGGFKKAFDFAPDLSGDLFL